MNSDNFFDGTFLLQLERLGVKAKTAVASHLRGQHRSKRSGQGMVFSDYRSYSEGDDTRNLDWGIFLRLDKLIIRLFEEEADLPIYIFLDVSESMSFGSPEKLHFGKKFSAALAYISLMNHDRVSLVAFSENVLQIMPTQRGNKQVWRTMHFLDKLVAQGKTNLKTALNQYFGAKRTRGLVVIVSDFLDSTSLESSLKIIKNQKHDLFSVHIISPQERAPSLDDEVTVVDSETSQAIDLSLSKGLIKAYLSEFSNRQVEIEKYFKSRAWGYLRADTDAPLEKLFLQALREKGLFL